MQKWQYIESILSNFCEKKQKLACIKKIRITISTLLIAGLSNLSKYSQKNRKPIIIPTYYCASFAVDHLISIGTSFDIVLSTQKGKDPIEELVKNHYRVRASNLIITVDLVPAWLAYSINCFIFTFGLFISHFLNIFIMVISVGLSTHFKLINHELEQEILIADPTNYPHHSGIDTLLQVNAFIWFGMHTFLFFSMHFRVAIINSGFECVKRIWNCVNSLNTSMMRLAIWYYCLVSTIYSS